VGGQHFKAHFNMAARPKVFFDITIGGQAAGRITFELFS
jgi:hypothetical protein